MNYCKCGRPINTTNCSDYTIVRYNAKGEIVFAVCVHGNVVINNEEEKH